MAGRATGALVAGDTQVRVLATVRAAGGGFAQVVFTRNRRVMASVGRGGTTLRLHESFACAPEPVLQALARLFRSQDPQTRAAARREVRAYLAEHGRTATAPRPRAPRRIARGDEPYLARLRAEFQRVNERFFGGSLPEVPLYLSGRMRRRNGHFCAAPLEIVISRRLCTHAAAGEAEHTLRHEMIHLWQHASGRRPDHGPEFRRWARRLDVHPRASRRVAWHGE